MRYLVTTVVLCLSIIAHAQTDNEQYEIVMDYSDYQRSLSLQSSSQVLIDNKKYKEALSLITEAINLNNGNADFYLIRALAYSGLKSFKLAMSDVHKAISLAPNQSDMYLLAANVLYKMGQYNDAVAAYGHAIENNDQSEVKVNLANVYFNRGSCHLALEKYHDANSDYEVALELNPSFIGAYHNRGVALKKLEKIDQACESFVTAKNMGSHLSDKYIEKYCSK